MSNCGFYVDSDDDDDDDDDSDGDGDGVDDDDDGDDDGDDDDGDDDDDDDDGDDDNDDGDDDDDDDGRRRAWSSTHEGDQQKIATENGGDELRTSVYSKAPNKCTGPWLRVSGFFICNSSEKLEIKMKLTQMLLCWSCCLCFCCIHSIMYFYESAKRPPRINIEIPRRAGQLASLRACQLVELGRPASAAWAPLLARSGLDWLDLAAPGWPCWLG